MHRPLCNGLDYAISKNGSFGLCIVGDWTIQRKQETYQTDDISEGSDDNNKI